MKKNVDYVAATIRSILFHGKRLNCDVKKVKANGFSTITWKKTVEGEKQKCTFKIYNHGDEETYMEHMHRVDALEATIYGKEE